MLRTGMKKTALVIGVDILSNLLNWEDRTTCILFGDGCGAAILQVSDKGPDCLIASDWGTNVSGIDLLNIPGGGSRIPISHEMIDAHQHSICMKGNDVFKIATRTMVDSIHKSMSKASLT